MSDERAENIRMIRASAGAVVAADGNLKRVRAQRFHAPGFERAVWRQMCEMGWLGLRLREAAGGAGLGMLEYCALCEELGRGLVPEPLIAAVLAARMLPDAMLAPVLTGERIVLPAWQESLNALEPETATHLDGRHISGTKLFIDQAGGADGFAVVARSGSAVVEAAASDVTLVCDRRQDGGYFGTLTLDAAAAECIAATDFAHAHDEATLATAAYLLGLSSRAFEITLDYLRIRRQFDRPIGSFQALQHRAADIKVQIELTRASIHSASAAFDDIDNGPDNGRRTARVSRAKARASDTAMLVARESVQMHGAIGYTDESDIGLYVRKAMTLANLFGSTTVHRQRYAATVDWAA